MPIPPNNSPLAVPGDGLRYHLVRSPRRRTLGIAIKPDAEVHVHAPSWMAQTEIDRLVDTRRDWIIRKQLELRRELQRAETIRANTVLYRGQTYPLVIRTDAKGPIYLDPAAGLVIDEAYAGRQTAMINAWLAFQAEEFIPRRTLELAAMHQIAVSSIRLADTTSQWGSCTSTGRLSFCWRLIMCPDRVTEYVIVHELAHRRQLNHSQQFWRLVETMCPDFRFCRDWLRRNSRLLRAASSAQ